MTPQTLLATIFVLLMLATTTTTNAFVDDAFRKVHMDFEALTRRVTARHILVSNEEIAIALKRKIRNECIEKERYVIDVFEDAAKKYSRDDTTSLSGGLLGELVPQGHCRSRCPELDRLCFTVTLGEVVGPLQTDCGYHLLLVSERTNCPKLDGKNTVMMQSTSHSVFGTLVPGKQVGTVNVPQVLMDQVGFWIVVIIAGGILAEVLDRLVSSALQS
jgi:peptidyl-prolyl cis-trans isomerase C